MHVPLVDTAVSDGVQVREEFVDRDQLAIVWCTYSGKEKRVERRRVTPVLHTYFSHVAAVFSVRRGWNCKPCERGNGNSSCYESFAHLSVPLQFDPPTGVQRTLASTSDQCDKGTSTPGIPDTAWQWPDLAHEKRVPLPKARRFLDGSLTLMMVLTHHRLSLNQWWCSARWRASGSSAKSPRGSRHTVWT